MPEKEAPRTKKQLIEKIIADPLHFTDADFHELTKRKSVLDFADPRKMVIRIFDINKNTLKEQSDATKGFFGLLNKRSTQRRRKACFRLIDKGSRDHNNASKKVIVAEGGSWFQFPVFIKDIINWLNDEPDYAMYSSAYGGGWFTNILYDEKYIGEPSIHQPDVFLISRRKRLCRIEPPGGDGMPRSLRYAEANPFSESVFQY